MTASDRLPAKPVPQPTPETAPFWDAAQRGELVLQRCTVCDRFYFYPRPFCPRCLSDQVVWEQVSGRATLHTYLINHRPMPGFEEETPYAIAVVELEEGPRMMTNIVGIENTPEKLVLDMALQVVFEDQGGMRIPKFAPAPAADPPGAEHTEGDNTSVGAAAGNPEVGHA